MIGRAEAPDRAVNAASMRFHGVLYTGVKADPNIGVLDFSKPLRFPVSDDMAEHARASWDQWMKDFGTLYQDRARVLTSESMDCK